MVSINNDDLTRYRGRMLTVCMQCKMVAVLFAALALLMIVAQVSQNVQQNAVEKRTLLTIVKMKWFC